MHTSTNSLIVKIQEEDCNESFIKLIERHGQYLKSYIAQKLGKDANWNNIEDLAQTTFFKFWKAKDSFNTKRKFLPWLFRIADNLVIDFFRNKGNEFFSKVSEFDNTKTLATRSFSKRGIDKLIEMDDVNELLKEIRNLPSKHRVLVINRITEDKSCHDLAKEYNLKIEAISWRIRQATRLLERRLTVRKRNNNAPTNSLCMAGRKLSSTTEIKSKNTTLL
jgi:RNA polymerase sigma-70 factor (ECF subfamily)